MRISDWSSDVCSSDLVEAGLGAFEKGVDAREAAIRGVVAILGLEQGRGQRRAQDQRDEHRQRHRRHDGNRELAIDDAGRPARSEEHTSELQSLMRISYAVFCLKKKNNEQTHYPTTTTTKKLQ